MTDATDKPLALRLKEALGDDYTIEGEIGRGGMSRAGVPRSVGWSGSRVVGWSVRLCACEPVRLCLRIIPLF